MLDTSDPSVYRDSLCDQARFDPLPALASRYVTVSTQVEILVHTADSSITWAVKDVELPYGSPLGPDQLCAESNVLGRFEYDPPKGTILLSGSHTLSCVFTPLSEKNYHPAQAQCTLVVTRCTPVLEWDPPPPLIHPMPLTSNEHLNPRCVTSTLMVEGTGTYKGRFKLSHKHGQILSAGR